MKKIVKLYWYCSFCLFLSLISYSFSFVIKNNESLVQTFYQESENTTSNTKKNTKKKKNYESSDSCYSSDCSQLGNQSKPYSFYYPYEYEYYYPQTD